EVRAQEDRADAVDRAERRGVGIIAESVALRNAISLEDDLLARQGFEAAGSALRLDRRPHPQPDGNSAENRQAPALNHGWLSKVMIVGESVRLEAFPIVEGI